MSRLWHDSPSLLSSLMPFLLGGTASVFFFVFFSQSLKSGMVISHKTVLPAPPWLSCRRGGVSLCDWNMCLKQLGRHRQRRGNSQLCQNSDPRPGSEQLGLVWRTHAHKHGPLFPERYPDLLRKRLSRTVRHPPNRFQAGVVCTSLKDDRACFLQRREEGGRRSLCLLIQDSEY